jgi:hypothetical protein
MLVDAGSSRMQSTPAIYDQNSNYSNSSSKGLISMACKSGGGGGGKAKPKAKPKSGKKK